jgi:hypothetical protein
LRRYTWKYTEKEVTNLDNSVSCTDPDSDYLTKVGCCLTHPYTPLTHP